MNCQPGSNAERISALARRPLYEKLYGHRLRLVTIYPGAWADQIRCQLDIFTLRGERLKYQALSYAWGRSMSKSAISLNTYEVFVTTNLELALRLLRHATKEVVLWIDALCINQSDMAERSEQVSRMREIFEGADNVVAFLGHPWMHYPEYHKKAHLMLSQEVVDLSAQLSSASVGFQRAKAMAPSVASGLPLPAHPVIEYLHFLAHLDPGDKYMKFLLLDRQGMFRDLFEGIRILLASAWWTRAWILQEIIVPEKAMILYGTVTFTWQSFYSISASIIAKGHAERLPAEYGKPLRSLAKLAQSIEDKRREWRTGGTTSNDLYSLLRDLGGRRATDDRDHINALLSLVGNGQTSLKPNYFWNVAQVYAAATLDILNRDKGSLRVLRGDLSRKGVHNLPSWVPDWSAPFDDLDRRREELIACHRRTPTSTTPLFASIGTNQALEDMAWPPETWAQFLSWLGTVNVPVISDAFLLLRRISSMRITSDQSSRSKSEIITMCRRWTLDGAWLSVALSSVTRWDAEACRMQVPGTGPDNSITLFQTRLGKVELCFMEPRYMLGVEVPRREVSYYLRRLALSVEDIITPGSGETDILAMAEANIANEMYDLDPVAFEPHWRFIRALVWDIVPDEHGKLRKFDIRSPRDRRVVFSWWLARLYEDSTKDRFPTEDRELHRKLDEVLLVSSAGRKFFSMEVCLDRVFGWGPKLMQQDDLVYQFPTSETPFILRERGHGRVLIGDCFVLGHMGDVSLLRDRNMEFRTFLNEGVEDLLWLRGICDTSDASYIDEVMRHIGQAEDDLTVEFGRAHDRKRNANGVIVMKAKDIY